MSKSALQQLVNITRARSVYLTLVLALTGCGRSTSEIPRLPITDIRTRTLPADGPKIPAPRGLTFSDQGDLYILDNAGRILVFDDQRELTRQWSMPEHDIGNPEGICLFTDGRIAVADTHYHRVVFFDRDGQVLKTHGRYGEAPEEFVYPVAITQDPTGAYYVCEYGGSDRVQKFSSDGEWLLEFGRAGTADGEFQRPSGITWLEGLIYVADAINNRIQVFREDGTFVRVLGNETNRTSLHYPYGISSGPDGDLFAIEYGGNRVTRLNVNGDILGTFGETGNGVGQFSTPWGIAVSSDGRIAIADTGNRRLVELRR